MSLLKISSKVKKSYLDENDLNVIPITFLKFFLDKEKLLHYEEIVHF